MTQVSVEQRFALLAMLGANADWDKVGAERLQAMVTAAGDVKREIGRDFTEFLKSDGRVQAVVIVGNFPTYQTIEIPVLTPEQWLAKLEAAGKKVSPYARDIMNKPPFVTLTAPVTLEFVKVTLRDLGFTDDRNLPEWREILPRARQLGLDLCSPESGPALRLAAGNRECFWVAMETIKDSDGNPDLFWIGLDDGESWLGTICVRPRAQFGLDSGIVFVRRAVSVAPKAA